VLVGSEAYPIRAIFANASLRLIAIKPRAGPKGDSWANSVKTAHQKILMSKS